MKDFLTILVAGLAILGVLLLWPSTGSTGQGDASLSGDASAPAADPYAAAG